MPLRKLNNGDNWNTERMCRHPEHFPPTMICLEPGTYEHTCPGCGRGTVFVVPQKYTLESTIDDKWRGERGIRTDKQLDIFMGDFGTKCSKVHKKKTNGHVQDCDCAECFRLYDLGCCGI